MRYSRGKKVNFKGIFTVAMTAIVFLLTAFIFSSCEKKSTDVHSHSFEGYSIVSPTCTEPGMLIMRCTDKACGCVKESEIPASGHNEVTVPASKPTCTASGYVEHIKCNDCDWTTLDESGILEPLGHDIVKVDDRQKKAPQYDIQYPTCTEDGYHYEYDECKKCGADFEVVKHIDEALGHNVSVVDARAASCNIGWDTFEYCKGWSTSDLKKKGYPNMPAIATSGPAVVNGGCGYNTYMEHPAIYDHVMASELEYVEVKAATCDEEGEYNLVRKCTTCSAEWPSWNKQTPVRIVEKSGKIESLGHEWQTHKGQAATCTNDGWEDFEMCSRCSKIDTEDGMIPVIPGGHQPSSDGCLLVCERCGYVDIDSEKGGHKIVTTVSDRYEPTCLDPGSYTCIKSCVKCGEEISREVVRIDAHGHDYIEHIATKPTCTTVGWEAFKTCSRCDYTELKEIPALGHTPDKINPVTINKKNATCTAEGYHQYVYYCSVCNDVAERHEEKYAIISHTIVTVAEKPATCVANGHSAYEYCGSCGKTLSSKYIYKATGHSIEYVDEKLPTCTEQGWYSYAVCKSCMYNTKAESMRPALGHDMQTFAAQAPTCTDEGWREYTACVREGCDKTSKPSNMLPATGHGFGIDRIEVIKAPTCTTEGTYDVVLYCNVCDVEIDRKSGLVSAALGHNYLSNGECERYSDCGGRFSIGLSYFKNPDGTYTVSGIGSCIDTELIIPDEYNGAKVVAIADNAFAENYRITSVKIGNNVTEIGQKAFYYCKNLKTVTIGASVTKVDINAFRHCAAITNTYYTGSNWGGIDFTNWNEDLTSKY